MYKWSKNSPQTAFKPLNLAFSAVAKKNRVFGNKKLLPARAYIGDKVTKMSVVRPVRHSREAALVNIFLPCEPLHAMGLCAVVPEAISCYMTSAVAERYFVETAENGGVPETFCSYHKIMIGLAESGVLPRPAFVLNTSLACDANQVSFRRLAQFYDVPQYYIDVPSSRSEEAVQYVADQIRGMTDFITEHTGRKLEEEKLRQAVKYSRMTVENYEKYLDLRAERSLCDEMTSELYSAVANHVLMGSAQAYEYSRRLVEQTAKIPAGRTRKRIVWMHTLPNWQDALKDVLDLNDRVEIVACDMACDNLQPMDENHPYESLARRLVNNFFNGTALDRLEYTASLARRLHADGVVMFCHWGCKQTLGAAAIAADFFREKGIPALILDGDGCDSANVSDGQMRTRMEAFVEQLEGGK
ncbi:MAG: 2-hydroxyacyl-CoA dehydratase [Oscillospiraceae bacterium]|nr:2-hydroxyacyl-CoA dehydratase [Oscillospiraceae bacterium]